MIKPINVFSELNLQSSAISFESIWKSYSKSKPIYSGARLKEMVLIES